MTVTWSGRVIPSTNQEIGVDQIGPGLFRYVYREAVPVPPFADDLRHPFDRKSPEEPAA